MQLSGWVQLGMTYDTQRAEVTFLQFSLACKKQPLPTMVPFCITHAKDPSCESRGKGTCFVLKVLSPVSILFSDMNTIIIIVIILIMTITIIIVVIINICDTNNYDYLSCARLGLWKSTIYWKLHKCMHLTECLSMMTLQQIKQRLCCVSVNDLIFKQISSQLSTGSSDLYTRTHLHSLPILYERY